MEVWNGGEEVESQAKAFSSVSVSAAQDAESFEVTQPMFDADAARRKSVVLLFLLWCERVESALFVRGLTVGVEFVYALIAGVCQKRNLRQKRQATVLEKGEVVGFSGARRHAHNPLLQRVDHDLPFLGVALLLAGVAAALFFWGRSMRCSLASTTITIRSKESSCNTFLPGR